MNQTKFPLWVWAALFLTVLTTAYSIALRHRIEVRNRAVSVAAEFENVEALAAAQGISVEDALTNLKAAGLNALVLSEETVSELILQGSAELTSMQVDTSTRAKAGPTASIAALNFRDEETLVRVQQGLRIRFRELVGRTAPRQNLVMLPDIDISLIRATPVGLNPKQMALANQTGLLVIARSSNPVGVSSNGVRDTVRWLKALGAFAFLPQGEQVLGRREASQALYDSLAETGMYYLSPEFAKLGGDQDAIVKMPDRTIRLHSAQVAELDKMSPGAAVDRYVRAARERSMRVLLVRPLTFASDAPLAAFGEFIKTLTAELLREGLVPGKPHPFTDARVPALLFPLMGLGMALVTLYLATLVIPSQLGRVVVAAILLALAAACITKTGRELMALATSMSFPLLGFVWLDRVRPSRIWMGFLAVSGFAMVGGMCVAGLLNGLTYVIRADTFSGVKISVFLPILLVGGWFFVRLTDWKAEIQRPITWATAALSLSFVVVVVLMLARTGNDNPAAVSGSELQFRNLLDNLLYVRPRTKEFLIGHPFLFIGIGLLLRRRGDAISHPSMAAVALMVGAIGQTSIVNTMCHLHTPVLLSVARIGIGLGLGCIMGALAWGLVSRIIARSEG